MRTKIGTGMIMLFFLVGCGGEVKELKMRDTQISPSEPSQGMKTVEFPKGTWTGAASKEQASTLAQVFVDSHNMAMNEFSKVQDSMAYLKGSGQRLEEAAQQIREANRESLELAKENQKTAQTTLKRIEELSRNQGTGEITLFYPAGSGRLKVNSPEFNRLVQFVDYLGRECKGRKILFVSLGSASAYGSKKVNNKLAKDRAESPQSIIDKYLVNNPHEYYKVYGTGDLYSPKGISKKEHERYQHTRVIAFYETDQLPKIPEGEGAK